MKNPVSRVLTFSSIAPFVAGGNESGEQNTHKKVFASEILDAKRDLRERDISRRLIILRSELPVPFQFQSFRNKKPDKRRENG